MRRKAAELYAATVAAVEAFSRIGAPILTSFDRRVVQSSTLPDVRSRPRPASNTPAPTVGRSATRFYDALDLLVTGPLKASAGRTALVILTDGVDTASRLADAETARRRLGESHLPVYVVHYDTAADTRPISGSGINLIVNDTAPDLEPVLVPPDAADPGPGYARAAEFVRHIAEMSGGRVIAAPAVADLQRTFEAITAELSQQFTVSYSPANQARDGSYRRVRVEIDRPGVEIRARAGYYAPRAVDVARRD
jgi:VWFA-related protein